MRIGALQFAKIFILGLAFGLICVYTYNATFTQPGNIEASHGHAEGVCEFEGLTEEEVFSGDFQGEMDDRRLVGYVRKCILIPPSTLPYNLQNSLLDPSAGQRKYVHEEWLGNKRNGVFIECAAYDGESLSNTLALERDFDWTGLLIEADPKNIKKMMSKNRKAWVAGVCAGIHPHPSRIEMFVSGSMGTLLDTNGTHIHDEGVRKSKLKSKSRIFVNCLPLYTIMLAANMVDVDYISLDIEYSDYSVLQTLPFDKINVKTFSVEANRNIWDKMRALMKTKDYTMVKRLSIPKASDDIYVHNSVKKPNAE